MAKEKFQDLQRAHEILKDNLERSKYDEDNPAHGYPEGVHPHHPYGSKTTKSATAKRYTGAAQSTPTPQWSTPGTFGSRGFPQQTSARAAHKATYEGFATEGTYRKPRSGHTFGTNAYYDDEAFGYYEAHYRPPSPRTYDRSRSQRQSTATPTNNTKTAPSSSRPRPTSTSGGAQQSTKPDAGATAQTPDFNLGAYIQERRAREAAAEAAEAKRKEEEETKRAREEQMRRERLKEELRRRREKERLSEEVRKAAEEAKKAEEDARQKRQWREGGNTLPRNGYAQAEHLDPGSFGGPYPLQEDYIERKVNEELRAKSNTSRHKSKNSPSKPRPRRSHESSETNGYAESWNTGRSGNNSDHSGGFATPYSKGEDIDENFTERMRGKEREKHKPIRRESRSREANQERWDNSSRGDTSRTHSRTKSDPRPPERRASPHQPRAARTATPPSPANGPKNRSPRIESPRPRRADAEFRFVPSK